MSLLAAVLAGVRGSRAAKRADRLAESYWDLRYEIGQMKVRINRLESAAGLGEADTPDETASPRSAPTTSFVPLSSLKK